ncbi:3,4-dihydroxy-9,10-secoandrosta-1,3,5(10)-triene-9,17-dione 4,5-dioxygenase [Collimonas sp. OK607]|uniref:VOC family protein n=1 Tax=Collimonas sp. OK607 TaxID=1798194 RepID=UPI0008E4EF2D|nr:VOC family protein [Collimonas sp. OK607]SFA81978.1 3,4-dihydroxy-9,10-secoandrosta-1,3,5(10)-triene-9,17-dione 4,5-dioxygenase [Collimonas sp. OK607]
MIDIRGLSYIVAESTDLPKWKNYAENVLGMMTSAAPDGGLYVKMDERCFRIAVQPGTRDAYVATGWEVQGEAEFNDAVATLRKSEIEIQVGDAAQCKQRCVQQLIGFNDPSGNRHEIVWGFKSDFARFASPVGVSRFITGNIGMGHAVLPAVKFEETLRFFRDVLGFGLSDMFNFQPGGDGPSLPIYFLHCNNDRHHSLALAAFPVESGCVHVMVEVESMPEVGRAMDRMKAHDVLQTSTLGQHTNDRMISFYMKSPSGFDIEFGYGGAVVDWKEHIAHEFTHVSLWGHDFSVGNTK